MPSVIIIARFSPMYPFTVHTKRNYYIISRIQIMACSRSAENIRAKQMGRFRLFDRKTQIIIYELKNKLCPDWWWDPIAMAYKWVKWGQVPLTCIYVDVHINNCGYKATPTDSTLCVRCVYVSYFIFIIWPTFYLCFGYYFLIWFGRRKQQQKFPCIWLRGMCGTQCNRVWAPKSLRHVQVFFLFLFFFGFV